MKNMAVCQYCHRALYFSVTVLDWCDSSASTACPTSHTHRHYPVAPVEGIDYAP